MTHTPGPWFVSAVPGWNTDSPQRYRLVGEVDGVLVDLLNVYRNGQPEDNETATNAHLMAAAPDLAKAAIRVLRVMRAKREHLGMARGNSVPIHESEISNLILWLEQALGLDDEEDAA